MNKLRILVTGGTGFLGKHLSAWLRNPGTEVLAVGNCRGPTGFSADGVNLMDAAAVKGFFDTYGPFDQVYALQGYNGGIAFNHAKPADIFHRNTSMALNLLQACAEHEVSKVLSLVASCAYPASEMGTWPDGSLREVDREELWGHELHQGPCHDTVACHGYAKRNIALASRFYHEQYGLKALVACPPTLYGPGDSFDPERAKVVGGMVKRFVDAVDNEAGAVACWGSGRPQRELLYVEDCAQLLMQAMEKAIPGGTPEHLGSGQEVSIHDLAHLIAQLCGFKGKIFWDLEKPDGAYRKALSVFTNSFVKSFGFIPLTKGLAHTITWYKHRKNSLCLAA